MLTKEQEGQAVLNFAAASFRKKMAKFRENFDVTAKEAKSKLDEVDVALKRIIEVNRSIRSNWSLSYAPKQPKRQRPSLRVVK